MAPEAKVALFEDDRAIRDFIKHDLEKAGHKVVVEAGSLQEALDALKTLRAHDVQVVILGGDLGSGNLEPASPYNDSQIILKTMRAMELGLKTVGMSNLWVEGVDIDVGKDNLRDLSSAVTKL